MPGLPSALRITVRTTIVASFVGLVATNARANIWSECGARYQAAKAENRLDGRNWRQFLESCRVQIETRQTADVPASADAQAMVLKACGARYRAAKDAGELGSRGWIEFLKDCRAGGADTSLVSARAAAPASVPNVIGSSPAVTPSPADPPSVSAAIASPPTAAEVANPAPSDTSQAPTSKHVSRSLETEKFRQKKCAAQWKAQKVELKKADPTLNWSRYRSECDKRLKVSGQ